MAGFISLEDAKAQLRVRHDEEDVLIQRMIDSASRHVERVTGLVAGSRHEAFRFDRFGRHLALRLRPVEIASIEITYRDPAGDEQEFVEFVAVEKHGMVRLWPKPGTAWPTTECVPGTINVTAQVGFGATDDAGAVEAPDDIKHAVRICVASWFADREEGTIPQAVLDLLDDERSRRV